MALCAIVLFSPLVLAQVIYVRLRDSITQVYSEMRRKKLLILLFIELSKNVIRIIKGMVKNAKYHRTSLLMAYEFFGLLKSIAQHLCTQICKGSCIVVARIYGSILEKVVERLSSFEGKCQMLREVTLF